MSSSKSHGVSSKLTSLQGGGGGPVEDDVTGLLVRSIGSAWAKNSILAVDAGVHLSSITRIMDTHMPTATRYDPLDPPTTSNERARQLGYRASVTLASSGPEYFSSIINAVRSKSGSPASQVDQNQNKLVMTAGPFKDLILPCETPKANAAYVLRNFISTFLITHAHLDHLSGFVVNTAAFQHTSRPKKLAALPHVIGAVKAHIFNDVVWPNLSDEEGGAGLVSYQRLTEGGNIALGMGEGTGYIEVCEGLAVKSRSVSHGHCMRGHNHTGLLAQDYGIQSPAERRASRTSILMSPELRRKSLSHIEMQSLPSSYGQDEFCVTDSSAFFIRDEHTGREVLIFGDVEPDSISLSPRTARVWTDAAPKIIFGLLAAIFIECSYDDSQPDELLFGHLAPRHLIAELKSLAEKVTSLRSIQDQTLRIDQGNGTNPVSNDIESARKRKRNDTTADGDKLRGRKVTQTRRATTRSSSSPLSRVSRADDIPTTTTAVPSLQLQLPLHTPSSSSSSTKPLTGLKIVIIHVKDSLRDGPPQGEVILQQLREHEELAGLGCEIQIARTGESVWL